MNKVMSEFATLPAPPAIGELPWSRDEMAAALEEFAGLYARRPVANNYGGMSSAHMFNFWFVLKILQPKTVIESGVFQGQGTWLIEQAVPDAKLYCIDINWTKLKYRSNNANYISTDFSKQDWSQIDKETTLCFFDDHMNAFERLLLCAKLGFRHIVFEDNYYPANQGDVYTLKQALSGVGYQPTRDLRYWASRLKGTRHDIPIAANRVDAERVRQVAAIYQELPPIFLPTQTRWGQSFDDFPTTQPLLSGVTQPWQDVFATEAGWYTWIAYVKLKQSGAN